MYSFIKSTNIQRNDERFVLIITLVISTKCLIIIVFITIVKKFYNSQQKSYVTFDTQLYNSQNDYRASIFQKIHFLFLKKLMIYPDRLEFNALLLIHELEQR